MPDERRQGYRIAWAQAGGQQDSAGNKEKGGNRTETGKGRSRRRTGTGKGQRQEIPGHPKEERVVRVRGGAFRPQGAPCQTSGGRVTE